MAARRSACHRTTSHAQSHHEPVGSASYRSASHSAADFYIHAHRLVFDAAWSLVESGGVPDLVSVWQTLVCRRQERELDPRSPARWLADLYDADPTGAWCDWACEVVRWHADRRAAIHRAREVLRDAYDGVREPEFYRRQLASLAR